MVLGEGGKSTYPGFINRGAVDFNCTSHLKEVLFGIIFL